MAIDYRAPIRVANITIIGFGIVGIPGLRMLTCETDFDLTPDNSIWLYRIRKGSMGDFQQIKDALNTQATAIFEHLIDAPHVTQIWLVGPQRFTIGFREETSEEEALAEVESALKAS